MYADLHLHTLYSDGTETPRRVVELAKGAGLSTIAITDHDNIDALPEAREVAEKLGIELISGIEMSACEGDVDVHLLGYLFDEKNQAFLDHLETQKQRRVTRVRKMIGRLNDSGIDIDAEEVFKLGGEGTVGRPHIARVLLKHGHVSTFTEAFEKYLGSDHPSYVPGSPLSTKEVIAVLRKAGGVPVVAHPIFMRSDELIDLFMEQGMAGIEVEHSSHDAQIVSHYTKMAEERGLIMTGGSDYHGTTKEGAPVGSVKIPVAWIDTLKAWKQKHAN